MILISRNDPVKLGPCWKLIAGRLAASDGGKISSTSDDEICIFKKPASTSSTSPASRPAYGRRLPDSFQPHPHPRLQLQFRRRIRRRRRDVFHRFHIFPFGPGNFSASLLAQLTQRLLRLPLEFFGQLSRLLLYFANLRGVPALPGLLQRLLARFERLPQLAQFAALRIHRIQPRVKISPEIAKHRARWTSSARARLRSARDPGPAGWRYPDPADFPGAPSRRT